MPCFLTCAFLFALYMIAVQQLSQLPSVRLAQKQLYAVLAPVALIVLAIAALSAYALGSWDEMLMLMTLAAPAAAVYACVKELRESDAPFALLVLFALFLVVLGFITIISRDGSSSTKVLFGFYKISKSIASGSLLPLRHVAENVLLFMPFGFLWAACAPGKPPRLLRAGVYALVLSAMIESIQYLLVIGECDLEDVLANVLGAYAGLGVYRFFERIR